MGKMRQILKRGQFDEERDESKIDYEFISPDQFFNETVSLIPIKNAVPAQRIFYGEKLYSQSIPLKYREAAFIQAKRTEDDASHDTFFGRKAGVVIADPEDRDSVVEKVTPDEITYRTPKGEVKTRELYNHFSLNRKTEIHNTPQVKVGDKISGNQILASSNFTDNKGTLAMGVNARVAVVPYKGWSLDDATVISESMAKRLTSEHMYTVKENEDKGLETNKITFLNLFKDKYTTDQTKHISDDGVIKPGTVVNYGDPLILSVRPKVMSSKENYLGRLSKFLKGTKSDASVAWDHSTPGVVTDVVKGKHGWKVNVFTESPAQVGDKLSLGRSGQKNTISKILPDNEMPQDSQGKPFEVIFNQLGLNSRINASTAYEILLGKVAEKTGKKYILPSFNSSDEKWYDFVEKELKDNNISDVEYVYDPIVNKTLKNPIMTGNAYVLKIQHMSDAKMTARNQGIYDLNLLPLKGGDDGAKSKRLSGLAMYGLLSAGAYDDIKDALHIRGQRNDDYWRQVRMGLTPTLQKKTPFVWDKYLALLRGSGFNVTEKSNKNGDKLLQITPMSDRQFETTFKPEELDNGEIVNFDDMQPVEGGLFSPNRLVTNGWGKITLDRPYPNPAFEDVIVSLLNIKKSDMTEIMSGKKELEGFGTGSMALKKALASIDTDKMLQESKDTFKTGPKTLKDKALNRIKYLRGLENNNMTPDELMIQKVPVLPPSFRPYSILGDTFIAGDANELYKDLFNVNQTQKALTEQLSEEDAAENSINVYNALKALYGYDESKNVKLNTRNVSGFLGKLIGDTSKFSVINRMVNSKPMDFTGGGVISPNPDLGMDEAMLPEDMVFELFAPRIQGELSKQGYNLVDSLKAIKDKTDVAKNALNKVLAEVPVILNREPSWHKFNSIGAWVKTHPGKSIYTSPIITSGISGDYNGDAQIGYVIALIPNDVFKKGLGGDYLFLTKSTNPEIISCMFRNMTLPTYDENKYTSAIINLSDFPKGRHIFSKEGKNGPIHFYEAEGIKVIALDETTSKPVWQEVSFWSEHPDREIEIVNLDQNLQIITDDDPRAVYGIDPNSHSFKFERFTPTDAFNKHVVVPRYKVLHDLNYPDNARITDIKVTDSFAFETTPEFGYFLGSMAGDGWVDTNTQPAWYLSDSNKVIGEKNKKYLSSIIPDLRVTTMDLPKEKYTNRYGDSFRFNYRSISLGRGIALFLKKYLDGHRDSKTSGAGNKRVPGFIASTSRECICGFLAGLMDIDGHIGITQVKSKKDPSTNIQITSTSLQMLRDVKFLFDLIGIKGKIVSDGRLTSAGNNAWVLLLSTIDFYKNGKQVVDHMVIPYKIKAFTEMKAPNEQSSIASRLDRLPMIYCLQDKILDTIRTPKKTKNLEQSNPLKYKEVCDVLCLKNKFRRCPKKQKEGIVSRTAIDHFLTSVAKYGSQYFKMDKLSDLYEDPNWLKLLEFYNQKDLQWLYINNIEYTGIRETGYDLSVPGYETFINSDGVVLSNTMTVQVPASQKAIEDIKNKLMPSKQVIAVRDIQNVINPLKQDYILGLFNSAYQGPGESPNVKTHKVNSIEEALALIRSGDIDYADYVELS